MFLVVMPRKLRSSYPFLTTAKIIVGFTFGIRSALLFGNPASYPDELKYPHTVPPELQFGNCGAKAGELSDPQGVCIGAEGEIYIADTSKNRIQVVSETGHPLRTWGEAGVAPGQFVAPRAITADSKGELLVADTGNSRIQVFDPCGGLLRQWGSYGEGFGQFKEPCGIAAAIDRVYVVDQGNAREQVFHSTGDPV